MLKNIKGTKLKDSYDVDDMMYITPSFREDSDSLSNDSSLRRREADKTSAELALDPVR